LLSSTEMGPAASPSTSPGETYLLTDLELWHRPELINNLILAYALLI
jgi:hypothetical protein